MYAYELPPDFLASPNYERLLSEHKNHGRALLEALHVPGGTEYEIELIGGPPAQALADVARVRHADEIIIGARGLGRMRALLGSVSHELLFIADRPVTVIPPAVVESDGASGPRLARASQTATSRSASARCIASATVESGGSRSRSASRPKQTSPS